MGSRLQKNSDAVRKRIEEHTFGDETGEEYEGSKFNGFSDYFRRKKLKLQNLDVELRSSSAGSPQIFKGIVAHVNGYTQPSLNDLHRLIVSHGGGFMQYLDGKTTVTHIIAANLTPKKAVEFKRYRIVKPAWVVDSVNSGRVLPWDNYKVIDEGGGQRLLGFNDGKIVAQAPSKPKGYREQTTGSWYASQVKKYAAGIDGEIDTDPLIPPTAMPDVATGFSHQSTLAPADAVWSESHTDELDEMEPHPSNTESYGVSSSLEDAFEAAGSKSLHEPDQEEMILSNDYPSSMSGAEENDGLAKQGLISSPKPHHYSLDIDKQSPSKKATEMTAEEHNAILLADPHIRKSSTANPDFIKQYYSESRLHHLSTWKADLKSRLQQMAAEKSPSQTQVRKPRSGSRRYIMHVDFDSFFCAVSLKSAPEFFDKPAVVAHGSGLGSEIASCNYPARAFGVKNGMWMKKALDLCPDIKVLPYDFPAYEEASNSFYKAILDVGGVVQSVSVDEALVDISSLCLQAGDGDGVSEGSKWREQEKANDIACKLRQRIKDMTGCAVSVGIGGNILLAKLALRKAKPAGHYQLKPEGVLDFIGELLVRDLPGVAHSIGSKLEELGVKYIKDIRSLSKDRLMTILGPKTGERIWDYSRGVDRTEVGEQVVRKSVSAEVNWGIRFINQLEAEEFVQNLCLELHKRLLDQGVKGKHLTMKIMRRAPDAPLDPPKHLGHGKCDTFNKSILLGVATNAADILGREAVSILRSHGFSPGELRGLGVQMTKLEPIKTFPDGRPDSSQKKISFVKPSGPRLVRREIEDPIDDPDSPRKPKVNPVHPAAAIVKANAVSESATKPLNLTGTQFLLPMEMDPTVLAELPDDIRFKLLAQSKSAPTSRDQSPVRRSRREYPHADAEKTDIPSQFDPEVFESLPEDVKAEVRASYSRFGPSRGQSLLPQSPRRARVIDTTKKTTPTKKRTGLLFHNYNGKRDANSTLTQSNFVIGNKRVEISSSQDSEGDYSDTLDPEFLSALPEDVRLEVITEHHRARLARHSGLSLPDPISRNIDPITDDEPGEQRKLQLPPRPPKPTFTTQQLSMLVDLRETLTAWHHEFRDEGPHGDDVAAMERYLRRVVLDERDMAKVVGVVKWIEWLIDEGVIVGAEARRPSTVPPDEGDAAANERERGTAAWRKALHEIKEKVQDAVRERGLGRLELDP